MFRLRDTEGLIHRLMGEYGLPALMKDAKRFKVRGKGHEVSSGLGLALGCVRVRARARFSLSPSPRIILCLLPPPQAAACRLPSQRDKTRLYSTGIKADDDRPKI